MVVSVRDIPSKMLTNSNKDIADLRPLLTSISVKSAGSPGGEELLCECCASGAIFFRKP